MRHRIGLAVILGGILISTGAAGSAPIFTPKKDADFLKFVEKHVQKADSMGGLRLYDRALQKTWTLKLVRIKPETIRHHGSMSFVVCADFVPVDGEKAALDVDFDADWEATLWDMEKVTIHKMNGEVRGKK